MSQPMMRHLLDPKLTFFVVPLQVKFLGLTVNSLLWQINSSSSVQKF